MPYDLYVQPKAFREALAIHQAFGRLGFPMDAVFVGYQPDVLDPDSILIVVLRWKGKQVVVGCGGEGLDGWSHEDFAERWQKFAVKNKHAPQEQLDRMWEESWVFAHKIEFATGLRLKGIRRPNLDADFVDTIAKPRVEIDRLLDQTATKPKRRSP